MDSRVGWFYFTIHLIGSQWVFQSFVWFYFLHKNARVVLNTMHKANIAKIKELAKEQGKSQRFLCDLINKRRTFLSEVALNKDKIDQNELKIIADELNTTVEYLTDQTDKKEKPTDQMTDGQIDKELLDSLGSLSEDDRRQVMAFIAGLKARR